MVKPLLYTDSVTRAAIVRELATTYLVVALITWAVTHIPLEQAASVGHLALAATFLFGALWLARRDPRGVAHFGIDLEGVLEPRSQEQGLLASIWESLPSMGRELGFALKVAVVVFPPFVVLFMLFHGITHPFTFHAPPRPLDFALSQLLVVALPEEALFRGYFQTRLADIFPANWRFLGADLSLPVLVTQALLFAGLHFLVGFEGSRLAVFFPGLLFGYFRARRGGIGAAVWFHAMCNGLSELLARGWL